MSPETLTSFIPIVDRLIALIKARDESHQHLVNDIVAPYFVELQSAYTAYLATLRKAKKMLEENQPFPVVYSEIEDLRAADIVLRDKVREMADAYQGVLGHPDIVVFFTNASALFGYWSGRHNSGTLRVMTALTDAPGVYSHSFVIESIEMILCHAEQSWRELSQQYALIRAKYLQAMTAATSQAELGMWKPGFSRRLLNSIRDRFFPTT